MNLGTNEIKSIYVGSLSASQMFLGNMKVWPEEEDEPSTENLILHFDAIDNIGIGQHSSNTLSWTNIAPIESAANCKLLRTSGTWENNAAVFTGVYNECFWLNTLENTLINDVSSIGWNADFTEEIAFNIGSSTFQNYRGILGKEPLKVNKGCIHVLTHGNRTFKFQINGTTSTQAFAYYLNQNSYYDYVNLNAFNTLGISWEKSTATLKHFINGVNILTVQQPNGIIDNVRPMDQLAVGGGVQQNGSNRVMIGKIYDFRVYTRQLTNDEMYTLHRYQNQRFN